MLRELEKEDLLRLQISELALKILEINNKRDRLIGQSVAIETAGMNYGEQKAYSLGIRWFGASIQMRSYSIPISLHNFTIFKDLR